MNLCSGKRVLFRIILQLAICEHFSFLHKKDVDCTINFTFFLFQLLSRASFVFFKKFKFVAKTISLMKFPFVVTMRRMQLFSRCRLKFRFKACVHPHNK